MRITIVAYYFYPDNHVAAIRPQNWADWLSEEHDVTVITREIGGSSIFDCPYKISRPQSYGVRFLEKAKKIRFFFKRKKKLLFSNVDNKNVAPKISVKISGAFYSRMPSVHDLWFLSCYFAIKKSNPDIIIATLVSYVSFLAAYIYILNSPKTKRWLKYRDI